MRIEEVHQTISKLDDTEHPFKLNRDSEPVLNQFSQQEFTSDSNDNDN